MKCVILFLFSFLISCSQIARKPAEIADVKHLVLDIDWTIVTEVKDPLMKVNPASRLIEVGGVKYFINEGLEELIEEALSHPDIRLSFYSGGKRERNFELLSRIKLKNGKSLKDVAINIFSGEELVRNEMAPEKASFSQRLKKDLTLISKNLKDIIMLDDTPDFVLDTLEKQSDSVFFIGKAFEYFDSFEDIKGKSGEYVPESYTAWLLNRKKLYILKEAFKESYLEASRGENSLLEGMKKREKLLDLKSHKWNVYSRALYSKAMKSLDKKPTLNCIDLASQLVTL